MTEGTDPIAQAVRAARRQANDHAQRRQAEQDRRERAAALERQTRERTLAYVRQYVTWLQRRGVPPKRLGLLRLRAAWPVALVPHEWAAPHSHGDFSQTVYETIYVTPDLRFCDDRGRVGIADHVPAWDHVISGMTTLLREKDLLAAWEYDHQ